MHEIRKKCNLVRKKIVVVAYLQLSFIDIYVKTLQTLQTLHILE